MLVPLSEEIRLLSASDILEPLSEEDLEELALHNPDVRLEQGETLFSPQEIGERLYIIKEGRIRLYKLSPEGEEMTVALVDQGMIFGEMALTAQQLREVYAQAEDPSLLISLSRESLEGLILNKPRVGLRLVERLSERVRALENRLEDMSFKAVPARLASLILLLVESEGVRSSEGYEIPTHYTHERLGTMIGAHRVAVTRAFRKLEEAEAVELRERRIHVKDIEALGRAAGEKQRAKRIANFA